MYEILRAVSPSAVVVDLGCGSGSFDASTCAGRVVRVDIERPCGASPDNFVMATAEALPFRDHAVQAIISNHSLEHLPNLAQCIREVGRVLEPRGVLYIAVPDSTTFADRLYRWLGRGGGHINPFPRFDTVPEIVQRLAGLRLTAAKLLCTSLSFANRNNIPGRRQKKLLLLAGGNESALRYFTFFLRLADRWFRLRSSIYGWAYYFGDLAAAPDLETWTNVCIRCGSAHPAASLHTNGGWAIRRYRCPVCQTVNFYTSDAHARTLRQEKELSSKSGV